MALTRANPQLKSLKIYDYRELRNNLAVILGPPLLQVQELSLSVSVLTLDEIVTLAGRLPELRILTLSDSKNIERGNATQPLPAISITDLHIDSHWRRSPGLAQLPRYCPNLEAFQFRSYLCPINELVSNLRQFCPKLKSLRDSPSRSEFYRSHLAESDVVHLLHATNRLVHCNLPIENFTPTVCRALLDPHAPFLETVHIDVSDSNESNFISVNRILTSCTNLRSFTLSHHIDADVFLPENSLAMFAEPWICPSLECLVLDGFRVYKADKLRRRLGNVLLGQLDQEEEEGRHVARPGAPGDAVATIKRKLYSGYDDGPAENQWTRTLAFHPPPDPEFYNKLVQHGWGMVKKEGYGCSPLESAERDSSRLEKIVQDNVFERVFAMANMREVTLENFQFRRT
ncbi:hypothetical protein BG000_004621, partial [Podila horticola]